MDTFHTRLRKLAETCEFENIDNEIKSQIIQSCSSIILLSIALREREIDLKQLFFWRVYLKLVINRPLVLKTTQRMLTP